MDKSRKKKAIAFLCSSNSWGGLEMNVLRLAGWMRDRSWPVLIYCRSGSPLGQHAEKSGLPVRQINPAGKYGGIFSARRLARHIKQDSVGYLLIQTNRDVLISALAKAACGSHAAHIFMQHMQIGRSKKDMVHTWEYSKLDAWISPLGLLADRVIEMTNLDPVKIAVIPLGMELKRFDSASTQQQAARQQFGIPSDALVIGSVGRIDRLKGQDVLIRAFARINANNLPLHLLLVGDRTRGESEMFATDLEHLVDQLGIKDRMTFAPHMNDIELAYAAMNIFVLPSHSETYGMVTIEAMASGLPVVATNAGGTPGIVTHDKTGLLVTPVDVEDLTNALQRLIDAPLIASRLAENARKEAHSRFSHTNACEQLESLLDRMNPVR